MWVDGVYEACKADQGWAREGGHIRLVLLFMHWTATNFAQPT